MAVVLPKVIDPKEITNVYLKDESGSKAMAIDGSTTPVEFSFKPGTSKPFVMLSFNILMIDNNIRAGRFGGINNGLTEGIRILIKRKDQAQGKTISDLSGGILIKYNYDFTHVMGMNFNIHESNPDVLLARLDLSKWFFVTELKRGHYISLVVQDNLSGIERFEATVQGLYLESI